MPCQANQFDGKGAMNWVFHRQTNCKGKPFC